MNTEHTNQPRQAANAAFEQWWQRHGLEDPMYDEDRYYITASSWARRGYLAAMGLATIKDSLTVAQQAALIENLKVLAKGFGHKVGCAKNAFGEQCTCGVDEAIAAAEQPEPAAPAVKDSLTAEPQAEQATLCSSCARANVDCPIYPQQTASCVEHRPAAQPQAEPVARIKTVGGYPDDSRHELELLVKHGQLSDGQLLYAAQPPAVAVPDGYALVPVEPTDNMFIDGMAADCLGRPSIDDETHVRGIWRAMLAAAQKGGA